MDMMLHQRADTTNTMIGGDLINMRNTVEATHQDMLAHPAQISQAKYV